MAKKASKKVKKKVAKKAAKAKKSAKKAPKTGKMKRVVAKKKVAAKKAVKPKKKVAAAKKPAREEKSAGSSSEKRLPPPQSYTPSRASVRLPTKKRKSNVKKLTAKELREFRQALLNLRDQVVDGISFLAGDNLNRSQRDASGDLSGYSLHMADQGTDNYDREFALNLVSSEQDLLYEIDEAIRRIDAKTYGICELTGEAIERARLNIIPYARYSVAAQSEMERGKTRYRPFGPTLSHGG